MSAQPRTTTIAAETQGERPLAVRSHGVTDRGRVRSGNEDQFAVTELRRVLRVQQTSISQPDVQLGNQLGYLFIVADGMGGHRGGEVASALAVAGIEKLVLNTLSWLFCLPGEGVLTELRDALKTTDRWVEEAGRREPELEGMGTTVTLGYFTERSLYVAHAGDSRCYLLRQGRLERLTRDHTLVARLVSEGAITADEATRHNMRNVVTNAVGGGTRGVQPEVHKHALEAGDVILMCTDGLTEMVPDADIARILQEHESSPEQAGQRLVDEANQRGGVDNITVVVARFDRGESLGRALAPGDVTDISAPGR
jgi:PPM family protein phosphatase